MTEFHAIAASLKTEVSVMAKLAQFMYATRITENVSADMSRDMLTLKAQTDALSSPPHVSEGLQTPPPKTRSPDSAPVMNSKQWQKRQPTSQS